MGTNNIRTKKFRIADRRRKLIQLMRENPGIQNQDLADELGVDKSTVTRDLKEINEELNMQTVENFMVERQRIISELESNKDLCMEKLKKLAHSPHQGARWMEEWNKLQEKIIRIYGIYSPEKMMIKHSQEFSKESKDAATNAALGVVEGNPTLIDITPKKQLSERTDGNESDDDDNSDFNKSVFSIA